jgi:hypothetical protein
MSLPVIEPLRSMTRSIDGMTGVAVKSTFGQFASTPPPTLLPPLPPVPGHTPSAVQVEPSLHVLPGVHSESHVPLLEQWKPAGQVFGAPGVESHV